METDWLHGGEKSQGSLEALTDDKDIWLCAEVNAEVSSCHRSTATSGIGFVQNVNRGNVGGKRIFAFIYKGIKF